MAVSGDGPAIRRSGRREARRGARRVRSRPRRVCACWTPVRRPAASPMRCSRRGAAEVVALDVGHGQLHERLRTDPRVEVAGPHQPAPRRSGASSDRSTWSSPTCRSSPSTQGHGRAGRLLRSRRVDRGAGQAPVRGTAATRSAAVVGSSPTRRSGPRRSTGSCTALTPRGPRSSGSGCRHCVGRRATSSSWRTSDGAGPDRATPAARPIDELDGLITESRRCRTVGATAREALG